MKLRSCNKWSGQLLYVNFIITGAIRRLFGLIKNRQAILLIISVQDPVSQGCHEKLQSVVERLTKQLSVKSAKWDTFGQRAVTWQNNDLMCETRWIKTMISIRVEKLVRKLAQGKERKKRSNQQFTMRKMLPVEQKWQYALLNSPVADGVPMCKKCARSFSSHSWTRPCRMWNVTMYDTQTGRQFSGRGKKNSHYLENCKPQNNKSYLKMFVLKHSIKFNRPDDMQINTLMASSEVKRSQNLAISKNSNYLEKKIHSHFENCQRL